MKNECVTDSKSVDELLEFGILNVDKPSGPTSFNVSDFVRKKLKNFGVRKTSHFGTLDPKVTGVLPIALNRACKLTGFFIGSDKTYVGIMRIHGDIEIEKIKKAIAEKFTGKIKQTPPVKSRVRRREREREIKSFEILEKNGKDVLFRSEVQGGTYIRKLISDLGDYLGIGAHMLELRRTKAGIFSERESMNLYDFEKVLDPENKTGLKEKIIPAEIVSEIYPVVQIRDGNLKKILTGKPVTKNDLIGNVESGADEIICVFSGKRFVGMYRTTEEKENFARPEFVFN